MTEAQYATLASELTTDPLGRGYAGMTDVQALADLNTVYRDDWLNVTGAEIAKAIDFTEYKALSIAARQYVQMVANISDSVPSSPGSVVRDGIASAFGVPSGTVTNLLALANPQQSRAEELGLAGWITEGRINEARA